MKNFNIEDKSFEIFFGTGGVGKTTVSTSRAIHLASLGKKVLLITIDPARRLKDLLKLNEDNIGEVVSVELNSIHQDFKGKLSVLLMSPDKTIARMSQRDEQSKDLSHNRIVKILSRPFGGMNEILALVELNEQFQSKNYNTIILDTAPGPHFVDFIFAIEKIKKFFHSSYFDIFTSLSIDHKTNNSKNLAGKIYGLVMEKGIKKLLDYLNNVTGKDFISDFLEALQVIYKSKNSFLAGLELEEIILSAKRASWFLVSSTEQGKADEASEMIAQTKKDMQSDLIFIINKSLDKDLSQWNPTTPRGTLLKNSLIKKEQDLIASANKKFKRIICFDEIISASPVEHLVGLVQQWNKYVSN